jgi:hypothetical protein
VRGRRRFPAAYPPVVDELRHGLGELREKILLGDARLLCSVLDSLLPERRAELPGFDWLILTGSEPGLDGIAKSCDLELFKQTNKAANKAAIWRCSTTSHLTLSNGQLGCRTATGQHPAYKTCAETKQQRF